MTAPLTIPARTMYDSVDAAAIPTDAAMVAGYVDGAYRWSDAAWARFPNAVHVGIATQASTNDGTVLDIERGDATPRDAPGWLRWRQEAGIVQPTLYCGLAAVGAVREACGGLLYWLWVADWTGQPHAVSYAAAVQYADGRMLGTGYDLSIVYDPNWPGPHVPPLTGEDDMTPELANLIVWEWYPSILRRTPASQDEVTYWASKLTTPGVNYEQVITEFCATPEAQSALARG